MTLDDGNEKKALLRYYSWARVFLIDRMIKRCIICFYSLFILKAHTVLEKRRKFISSRARGVGEVVRRRSNVLASYHTIKLDDIELSLFQPI